MTVLQQFQQLKSNNKHAFAVLIDPDSVTPESVVAIAHKCNEHSVDFVFVGGSLLLKDHVNNCIEAFKQHSKIPVVLFPGNPSQIANAADALLYLSLISGRNPELLIGHHVTSAPQVKQSGLEVISTGYMVIDGGVPTTVSYMSHAAPIPHNKPDIALCTAWAGELQGKHVIYMDAGSGAKIPISETMIQKVSSNIALPLIIGGGISSGEKAYINCKAGAQVIVVGNAIETNPQLIKEIAAAVAKANRE